MADDVADETDRGGSEVLADVPIHVATLGQVSPGAVSYAEEKLGSMLAQVTDPILFARVKLSHAHDPARERPAMAQLTVDINGELVRAQVAAHEMPEAIDLLQGRLRDKLEHRAARRRELRRSSGLPGPGEWRHGDLPTSHPTYFDRPEDEREIVAHKTFGLEEMTPDEAAFDMEQLDYDFYLFRDLSTGDDAVLERSDGAGYRMTRLHPSERDPGPLAVPVEVVEQEPSQATVDEAVLRLDDSGEPFVFFRDAATQRGRIIYRRYDGHYGLITPTESEEVTP